MKEEKIIQKNRIITKPCLRRTLAKAEAAKKEVGGTGKVTQSVQISKKSIYRTIIQRHVKVIPVIGDLSSLTEVQQLAEQAKALQKGRKGETTQ